MKNRSGEEKRGEGARGETVHQDYEGGKEEERENASAADRHRLNS